MAWKKVPLGNGQTQYLNFDHIARMEDLAEKGAYLHSSSGIKFHTPLSIAEVFELPDISKP